MSSRTPRGGPEEGVTPSKDTSGPFNDKGVVITAAAGDNGYLDWMDEGGWLSYPAASPHVVAVGGTRLTLGEDSSWDSETVWNGDGSFGRRLQR